VATEVKREEVLGVRLYSTERDLIERHAKDDGRTASAFVRHIVLSHLQNDESADHKDRNALSLSTVS
jgi:hypothetical protein